MSRRFLLITLSLMFVLTCTRAEQAANPSAAVSVAQAEAPAEQTAVQTSQTEDTTPEFVKLLLSVAKEELGYTEAKNGYTKFGDWSGDPKAQWCAEFLCWSVDQTDKRYGTDLLKKQYPLYSGTNVGRDWFIRQGRYVDRRGTITDWGTEWFIGKQTPMTRDEYVPQPGDWVFFTWRNGPDTDHVAMVEYSDVNEKGETVVHVIEGNNPSKVAEAEYLLSDPKILGYGTVTEIADVTMRAGNTGVKVRKLQAKLNQLGLLDTAYVDGDFGAKTVAAVKAFQKANLAGKTASGIADMETQFAMDEAIEKALDADKANWIVAEN